MAEFEAIFTDVGQGDSTLLRLPDGEYMLFDVYRCEGSGIDIFKLLDDVLPEGEDGRKRLKYLVISHAHDDHITGIGDLYDRYEVEWLWVPQHEERKQIAKNFGDYQRVVDEHPEDKVKRPQGSRSPLGDNDVDYDIEGLSVRCFSPPGYIEIDESLSEEEAKQLAHENCLVLKISHEDGTSVMLTGDSDLACWQRIVGYYEGRTDEETGTEVLAADILHASHHGSRTFFKPGDENSEAWLKGLELIDPDAVVVSVGENNRHAHPHADMMTAYRDNAGTDNVFETCQTGTIIVEVDDEGYQLRLDSGTYADSYGWDDDDTSGASANAARETPRPRRSSTRLDNQPAA